MVVNGFVVGANITDGGLGYTNAPTIQITGGGGTGASGTATIDNGTVTAIRIINPGSGYTSSPTIIIDPPPFPPRPATGIADVVNGFVVDLHVIDGGNGYVEPPLVLLTGGGGSGATAVAVVTDGVVTSLKITNPGTGYTSSPDVVIASPLKSVQLGIRVSRVAVDLHLVLGKHYLLESSKDLTNWTPTGDPFTAQSETMTQEFLVNESGQFFRLTEIP